MKNTEKSAGQPRRLTVREIGGGEWLKLEYIEFEDRDGRRRSWEAAGRRRQRGAVVMIARLRPSGDYVLVEQYRPPVNASVLEFPAGLVDAAESPETTAVRELLEETGYRGTLLDMSPASLSSPGMSAETAYLAVMDIDENRAENRTPRPQCEEGEHIEVFRVAPAAVREFLARRAAAGVLLDSKVRAYFLGAAAGSG